VSSLSSPPDSPERRILDGSDAAPDTPPRARKRRAVQQRGTRFTVTYFGPGLSSPSDSSAFPSSQSQEEGDESKEGVAPPVGDGEEAEAGAPVVQPPGGDAPPVQRGDGRAGPGVPDLSAPGQRLSRDLKAILLGDKQVSGPSPTRPFCFRPTLSSCECPFFLDAYPVTRGGSVCPVHCLFAD